MSAKRVLVLGWSQSGQLRRVADTFTQPFTMAPYWSLSYEAWYYAFFGLVFFLKGWLRWVVRERRPAFA